MLTGNAHRECSLRSHFGGRAGGQGDPAPFQRGGQVSGGDAGTSRKRKGNRKGHRAEGLEQVHSESEKQAATGTSGAKSFEADGLAPGKSFGPESVILPGAFAQSSKSSAAFQGAL